MGDIMFDVATNMEDDMRVVVDFLNADTQVRNTLIKNFGQFGESSLEEIGSELSSLFRRRGIEMAPRHIAAALRESYDYGVQRYVGEYDNSSISEKDIFNENVAVDDNGIENVMRRRNRVSGMVGDLDCRNHHVPNCWADFVNRGYSQIKKTIFNQLGDKALADFEYYFNYDTRDVLKSGLLMGLTRVYDKSVDEVQGLYHFASKLEERVQSQKDSKDNLAAMFK